MRNTAFKHTVVYAFLLLFTSMKVAGLHALKHLHDDNSAKHCTVCDFAVAPNYTPVLLSDSDVEIPLQREEIVRLERAETYNFVYIAKFYPDQLFSRPPPSHNLV